MKYTARTVDGMARLGVREWNRLDTRGNPFLSWAFLSGLESSGSISAENGWQPHHLCIFEGKRLLAAAPSYLKMHSRGEFVFDWAWADAYHRNQLDYFPKLLTAVPWTPVAGPRLLVACDHPNPAELRQALVDLALLSCDDLSLSSWHCNFVAGDDHAALESGALLQRRDCQFHWHNRGYQAFDDFLETLKSKKRKNIRQERRQVAEYGIRFEHKQGDSLNDQDIRFIHRCYRRTFHAHGNHPALSRECFEILARDMPQSIFAVFAYEGDEPLAMSLFFQGAGVLYGRYWGTLRDVPGLHFETAYYQGIGYCIAQGLQRFESGAQGEHKIARGFEPARTHSYHFIAHEGFRTAISEYLDREAEWMDEYRSQIDRHIPFKAVATG